MRRDALGRGIVLTAVVVGLAWAGSWVAAAAVASAQSLPPLTDRDYAIDLHQGVAIGSTELIGQGGAGIAMADGSVGTLLGPAAAATRPNTVTRAFRVSAHLDWLAPRDGNDLENSGLPHPDVDTLLLTGGLSINYRRWGLAVVVTTFSFEQGAASAAAPSGAAAGSEGAAGVVGVSLQSVKIAVARTYLREQWAVGAAFRSGVLGISVDGKELFATGSQALEAGVIYRPAHQAFRVGVAASAPVGSGEVQTDACDPADCAGYILPDRVALAPTVRLGGAYRLGPSPWNIQLSTPFRDERHVTFIADVAITGRAPRGAGLGAFLERQLQRSGQHLSVNVHAGASGEVVPGRVRVRAGSYWEAGRLQDRRGRLHATTGADVRVFAVSLAGLAFRMRLTATLDIARHYLNGGLSVGFWP